MPSRGSGLENGGEALKAYICTLTFLDLLHINCLNAPISAVSEQNLPKQKMGRGTCPLATTPCNKGRSPFNGMLYDFWGGATTPCNAVVIYELF